MDINTSSLLRAKEAGADIVINSAEEDPVNLIREITKGKGVDIALECIGMNKTIDQVFARSEWVAKLS